MKSIKIRFDGFFMDNHIDYNREAKFIISLLEKNYRVEISEDPDYLFYNVNGIEFYKFDCIRIFCTIEAICPDFNFCDYGIGFEYLSYGDRYFRFPNYLFYTNEVKSMLEKHNNVTSADFKRDFCSFVYSNNRAETIRGELFENISHYRKVNSGGRYLNNLQDSKPVLNKILFENKHKFSIACENASHPGYHTEKIVESFAARTIPIYWGNNTIEKEFNTNSFINCNDFDSLDEVIQRIIYLDNNEEEYLKILNQPAILNDNIQIYYESKISEFEEFLKHIINQPIELAFRRNRGFWGRQYLEEKKNISKIVGYYNQLRNFFLFRLLRKCLRK